MASSVYYLQTSIPWFGRHSGYEQLTRFIDPGMIAGIAVPSGAIMDRLRGKLASLVRGYGRAPQGSVSALLRMERWLSSSASSVGHILYGEDFLRFLSEVDGALLQRVVITLHQPRSQWTAEGWQLLSRVKNAIVLYSRDLEYFAAHVSGRVTVIRHGVDTTFFKPDERRSRSNRVLYSGVHLRNTRMLRSVVERLSAEAPDLNFDCLVPVHRRSDENLMAIASLPNVTWHSDLTDEQLLSLYQASAFMLLPLHDAGANTAVVEALASGLPIVTTDVGGIRDYGGGSLFSVVEAGDVEAMVALAREYLSAPRRLQEISRACREFAETQLDWPVVARQHMELYRASIDIV